MFLLSPGILTAVTHSFWMGDFFCQWQCHGRHTLDDIHAHIIFILQKNSHLHLLNIESLKSRNSSNPILTSPTFPNKTCFFGVNFPWFLQLPHVVTQPITKWQHQLHLCPSRPANTKLTSTFEGQLLQSKAFSHQNKGHLGSRGMFVYTYIYIYLYLYE